MCIRYALKVIEIGIYGFLYNMISERLSALDIGTFYFIFDNMT